MQRYYRDPHLDAQTHTFPGHDADTPANGLRTFQLPGRTADPKLQNECSLEIECLLGLRGVVGGATITLLAAVASPSTEAPSEDRGPQDQSLAGFPSIWLDAVPKVGRGGHIDLALMHVNLMQVPHGILDL